MSPSPTYFNLAWACSDLSQVLQIAGPVTALPVVASECAEARAAAEAEPLLPPVAGSTALLATGLIVPPPPGAASCPGKPVTTMESRCKGPNACSSFGSSTVTWLQNKT